MDATCSGLVANLSLLAGHLNVDTTGTRLKTEYDITDID